MTRAFYTWLLRLAFPYVCLRLFLRGLRNRDYWRRLPERFGFVSAPVAPGAVWVHAVSVGEVRASVPLVRALRARRPVVLTAMTPTGVATARALFDGTVAHGYVPYDYPGAVNRFLDRVRPALVVILEKELWPNLVHFACARGIPVCVANAQLGPASLRGWLRLGGLAAATFGAVNAYAAQTEADARRLIAAGARPESVQAVGSIKFELALPDDWSARAQALRRAFGLARPVWLTASTHDGEEDMALTAHVELKQRFPGLLLVVVPRHPERFDAVARLCARRGFHVARRSAMPETLTPDTDVLVGDTMGELPLFYGACDVAFVGGSLAPAGGHNFLEASAVGVPAVFGPDMANIEEIAQHAVTCGAATQIAHGGQLADAVARYLADPARRAAAGTAGKKLVEENRGALARTLALIEQLLAR
jgi:3-deoxy-D-manno-octulosonic-acid transferase